MKFRKRGLRAAAVVASVASAAFAAAPAMASTPPGATLVQANVAGWSGMSYRPGHIYAGNGGAPQVYDLSWKAPGDWSNGSATTGGGRIRQFWPNGGASSTWPSTTRPASVYLHDELSHSGQPYFAKMRWNWTNAKGKARVAYWLFATYPDGSVPAWQVRS